ncbi:MAG: hypothetical protein ACR2LI_04775 [Propionibacteriaceae bacterium]
MQSSAGVVFLAGSRPAATTLTAAIAPWRADGAELRLAGLFDEHKLPPDLGLTETHALNRLAESQGPRFRRQLRAGTGSDRLWRYAQLDPWLRRRVAAGDRVVGLDPPGHEVADRLTRVTPWWRIWWRSLRAGGPGRLVSELARDVAVRLTVDDRGGAGRRLITDRLIGVAAALAGSPRRRADVLGDFTAAELGAGLAPSRLAATAAAELAVADQHLARGRTDRAAEALAEALHVMFHRAVQFDRLDSPLPADPGAFTAVLARSTTARQVMAPRGRVLGPRSARPEAILLATHGNTNFLGPVADRLRLTPEVALHHLDLATHPEVKKLVADRATLITALLDRDPRVTALLTRILRPHLDRVDVVFVDWCTAFAVLVTAIDPGRCRIIVRLHSYEALSPWPQLVDFSRVDDVVFVSDHLRDLAVETIVGLRVGGSRRHVLPIGVDTAKFRRPKDPQARFTLGLVGYAQIAKDPLWALDVVRRLRIRDERYRLVLIGSELRVRASAAARVYDDRFWSELSDLETTGAVRRYGHTDDVAAVLTGVGVILSTSVRESFHLGLIEGAASGAVPVVRDWPLFATRPTGAHSLFPASWVVNTPLAAVERVVSATRTEQDWHRVGSAAAEVVRRRWDTSVTDPLVDELFFGTDDDG